MSNIRSKAELDFISRASINDVGKKVSQKIKRNLSSIDTASLYNFMKGVDVLGLYKKHRDMEKIRQLVAESFSKKISVKECDDHFIDVHEMLKNEIGVRSESDSLASEYQTSREDIYLTAPKPSTNMNIMSIFNKSKKEDIADMFNPESLYRTGYMYLDSRYRILDSDGTTEVSWNIDNSRNLAQGTVNIIGKVRDIVMLRICKPFYIQRIVGDNELDFYQEVTIFIKEFSAQSFIGQENRQFHFVCQANNALGIGGKWLELDPTKYDRGRFRFRKPITQLDKLTLTFGTPLQPLILDTDRLNCTFTYDVNGDGTAGGGTGLFTLLTTVGGVNHNLSTGDLVYMTTFTTADTNANVVIIRNMNNLKGLIISKVSNTSFTVQVATTTITPSVGLQVSVYFGSKRFVIPLQVTYIETSDQADS